MNIQIIGSKILETKCEILTSLDFSDNLCAQIAKMQLMLQSMSAYGLAAPQVNIPKRFFIVSHQIASAMQGHDFFANPEITWPQCKMTSFKEGCLSIPNVFISIERPELVTITAQDRSGAKFTLSDVSGLQSRVIQHEFDHLNGILMNSRASELDKLLLSSKIKAARRLGKKSK